MFGEWQSARDFFSAVGQASDYVSRHRGRLESMEAREGARAQGYEPSVSRSRADVNGTAATVARMDYEAREQARVDEAYRLIDLGVHVAERVGELTNREHADVLELVYEVRMQPITVADRLGVSVRTVYNRRDAALAAADALGFGALACGSQLLSTQVNL